MDLTGLTRKHGLKLAPCFACSVEDCGLAVGGLVGHGSVKSAARMNHAVVIFVDSVEKARKVVASGVVVRGTLVPELPLAEPAVRVTVSNVPPFVPDDALLGELVKHGTVVSQMRKVSSGCRSPLLRHVVSHRRQLHMVLAKTQALNLVIKVRIEGFEYVMFATSDNGRCFRCGGEGHLARGCPVKSSSQDQNREGAGGAGEEEGAGEAQEVVGELGEGVSEARPVGQVGEGVSEGVSMAQPVGQVGEGVSVGMGEARPVGQVGEGVGVARPVGQVGEGVSVGVNGEVNVAQWASLVCGRVKEGTSGMSRGSDCKGARGSLDGGMGVSDSEEEMEEGRVGFKVPHLKRKTRASRGGSQAKRGGASSRGEAGGGESDSSSGWGSAISVSSGGTVSRRYGAGQMKEFLHLTKNERGVRLEEYFSDVEKFARSARHGSMKKGAGDFTQQEVYRLRKFLLKINQEGGSTTGTE
ncbi:uncharacterized protein ACO6RY_04695 [Pungitius sinensis]